MRTSKKILSFFLAVVMVVTTCSVGFTAFAKSNDNPLWKTTSVDADSAFDTLNKLADQLPSLLMGIVGGFLPAVRAARMNIVTALRQG